MMNDLFKLAMQGVKQKSKLTVLMIVNLVIGITLLLTMSTTVTLGSSTPLASKAENVINVSLNFMDAEFNIQNIFRYPPMTYQDAEQLKNAQLALKHLSFNYDTRFVIAPEHDGLARPIVATASATDKDYFKILDVNFIYGGPWDESQTDSDVIVIDKKVNDQLFASENSIGNMVKVNNQLLKVVGVMDLSHFKNRFQNKRFSNRYNDLAALPLATAERINAQRSGRIPCQTKDEENRNSYREFDIQGLKSAECGYLTVWAELDDENAEKQLAGLNNWSRNYVKQQNKQGRFPHADKYKLTSLKTLSDENSRFMRWEQVYLQFAYLLFAISLVNTVGILLAKYQAKTKLVSLYRALGANRLYVIKIHLIEISIIALAAIFLGIAMAHLGLELMFQVSMYQMDYSADPSLVKHLYSMDYHFVLKAGVFIYSAIIVAGLYPVIRISGVSPAAQLRG